MSDNLIGARFRPLGFIVEGHGEYNCYPSLVCRILRIRGIELPIVNAKGCGNIRKHLGEHLTDLITLYHPCRVIVSCDLVDLTDPNACKDCQEVKQLLDDQINEWFVKAASDLRCQPLPKEIKSVIQIKKFETWIIADTVGLRGLGINETQVTNVDDIIHNPARWLESRLSEGKSLKNPKHAKEIVGMLDTETMRRHSRSFDKFFRETDACYSAWCREQGYL